MAHGHGIATVSLAGKDRLRNTTVARCGGRKVQARAFTTHAQPVMQGIFDVEEEDNFDRLFRAVETMWGEVHPERPPLRECVVQLHKDYAAPIENARLRRFPRSRPMNDFFHLLQKEQKVIEKKLQKQTLQHGKFVKEELAWIMAALMDLRDLPTLDLYSALHAGFLHRLREKGEPLAADYLGPEGRGVYTQAGTLAEFKAKYNVRSLEAEPHTHMLYSPHWQGMSGIVPGTACGDEPQEAMHSAWERHLDVRGKEVEGAEVLTVMQQLYTHQWAEQFEWGRSETLHLCAPLDDPSMLNGTSLAAAGRSNAMELWTAAARYKCYEVYDQGPNCQVVAVLRNTSKSFDAACTEAGVSMLFAHGTELHKILVQRGLLAKAKTRGKYGTILKAVRAHFGDYCYVIVARGSVHPFPVSHAPLGTCKTCGRYGSCEHTTFVKMLDLRLRAQSIYPASVPSLACLYARAGLHRTLITERDQSRCLYVCMCVCRGTPRFVHLASVVMRWRRPLAFCTGPGAITKEARAEARSDLRTRTVGSRRRSKAGEKETRRRCGR